MTPRIQAEQLQFALTFICDNNPSEVSSRLYELGILSENVELNSDQAFQALATLADNGQFDKLRQAVKVPFNEQAGNYTVYMKPFLDYAYKSQQ